MNDVALEFCKASGYHHFNYLHDKDKYKDSFRRTYSGNNYTSMSHIADESFSTIHRTL